MSTPVPGDPRRSVRGVAATAFTVLAVTAWGRVPGDGLDVPVVVAAGLLVVGGTVAVVTLRASAGRVAQCRVAAVRRGSLMRQLWAGEGLGRSLLAHGGWAPRVRARGGTALTLAVSGAALELWRGSRAPHVVVPLPWPDVRALTTGVGVPLEVPGRHSSSR
ncbi:MAG: hypothetical protein HHJ14_06120 [Cellulomonas sp.]|uniref:hypothetical protein n=1 Tax=Cellulomonas sp. TaxID=40001 RepID=UPI0017AC2FC8|nr:hypothetical protein [Cellulomonas sp.]NMM16718.1 hypothetical protein [Cellulomonas sp.]NMM29528.1 hypothetical protein [Cellulomonas sp.]